jgi:Replication-relaxation
LFFSSRRRAQDRLVFLYRHRVVDRFYPPAPFGLGKPQAHWLLDEAGAILVAARLGVERKKLGWQRRDGWGSHPQLAHRLETNRFVTDLIAATLPDPTMGVMWWAGPAGAARRFDVHPYLPSPRPDAGFELVCAAGSIECYLEWDRATETKQRLRDKLRAYLQVHEVWEYSDWPPLNLLVVVPTAARLATLEAALGELRDVPILQTTTAFPRWSPRRATRSLECGGWPFTPSAAKAARRRSLRRSQFGVPAYGGA